MGTLRISDGKRLATIVQARQAGTGRDNGVDKPSNRPREILSVPDPSNQPATSSRCIQHLFRTAQPPQA